MYTSITQALAVVQCLFGNPGTGSGSERIVAATVGDTVETKSDANGC